MKQTIRWDYSHATYSGRDEDGFPIVQADAYGDEGGASFSLEHPYGFYSRPHDPTPDGFCTLFVAKDGSTRFGLLGMDPRFIQDVPLPPKGSAMQYVAFQDGGAWKTAFMFLSGDDGTLQYYKPHGSSAISVTVGLDGAGEPTIELRQSDGSLVTLFDGKIVLKAPGGGVYIEVSDDGIVLRGPITAMGGLSPPGGMTLAKSDPLIEIINAMLGLINTKTPLPDPSGATATANAALAVQIASALALLPTSSTRGV